jgi:hypothetical protein
MIYDSAKTYASVSKDLSTFGNRIVTELDALGRECDMYPPILESTDAWGRRVDRLHLTPVSD